MQLDKANRWLRLCLCHQSLKLSLITAQSPHNVNQRIYSNKNHDCEKLLFEKALTALLYYSISKPVALQSAEESGDLYSKQLAYPYQIPSVDLFWSVHYNVPILPIRPCKRLTTLHDVAHLALPLPALKRGYAQFMIRRALHLSDHIITVSDFSKREIECHTGKISSPISVIALGVDHARFYPLKKDDSSILQRYGIKAPFLLYVGSLKKRKKNTFHSTLKSATLFSVQTLPKTKGIN